MSPQAAIAARGWCPSLSRPMASGDGLIVRLHPPGGLLRADDARLVADAARECGNGLLDVTSRGNLQIRGLRSETHRTLLRRLAGTAFDEEQDGGERRLAVVAPLAGLDPQEQFDSLALAAAVEGACKTIRDLPDKTCVAVDGGGRFALDAIPADVPSFGRHGSRCRNRPRRSCRTPLDRDHFPGPGARRNGRHSRALRCPETQWRHAAAPHPRRRARTRRGAEGDRWPRSAEGATVTGEGAPCGHSAPRSWILRHSCGAPVRPLHERPAFKGRAPERAVRERRAAPRLHARHPDPGCRRGIRRGPPRGGRRCGLRRGIAGSAPRRRRLFGQARLCERIHRRARGCEASRRGGGSASRHRRDPPRLGLRQGMCPVRGRPI